MVHDSSLNATYCCVRIFEVKSRVLLISRSYLMMAKVAIQLNLRYNAPIDGDCFYRVCAFSSLLLGKMKYNDVLLSFPGSHVIRRSYKQGIHYHFCCLETQSHNIWQQ